MLKVDNLNIKYGGIHAVRGINFEVPEGKIVAMIGANGAGKSSTLIIATILPSGTSKFIPLTACIPPYFIFKLSTL
ncbi:MAG TPA: ATP-binding cassette domain-containing protein, partial [Thermoanaerobacterales bacterium]|nr:ATP-binding cassette domain-containing protein [Thermoanaerobacterales bacterium]